MPTAVRTRRTARAALVAAALLVLGTAGWSALPADGTGSVASVASVASGVLDGGGSAGGLGAADAVSVDGEPFSPFADAPALTRLDPALRTAVQDASVAAGATGLRLHVTSGWRSAAHQQSLFDAAVAEHGSPAAARAHVLPPEESAHVTGDAVDIGPVDAMDWLSRRGDTYGLCQTYANEMWHFELATERGGTCPEQLADASVRPAGSDTP